MLFKKVLAIVAVAATISTAGVNKNTGQMSFSHKLFQLNSNELSFDMDLLYNSGITIDQRASWVGLGFDLSIPYIERIPVGSVDEKADSMMAFANDYTHKQVFRKLITQNGNGYTDTPEDGDFTNQLDIYTLSAPFASGRILFGQPENQSQPLKAYLQNWRQLKIDYFIDGNDDVYKWEITDESGVVYVFAMPLRAEKLPQYAEGLTSITFFGEDGVYKHFPSWTDRLGNIRYGHRLATGQTYVNEGYNRRWYLTEIRGPNYSSVEGGEKISITYSQSGEAVEIRDLFSFANEGERAVTDFSRFYETRLLEDSGEEVNVSMESFTYSFDRYKIYPVYPEEIVTTSGKAKFKLSEEPADDIVIQGDRRIDEIELYTRKDDLFIFNSKIKFNYDEIGLSPGHPYSSNSKGLLKLKSVERVSINETPQILLAFDYASNPEWGGFYRHDLYGYYSSTELRRDNNGVFIFPQGQSYVGNSGAPGAEAWSVSRILSQNGSIREYRYEPNVATRLSTNQIISTENAPELNPGIRVKTEKLYDGLNSTPLTFHYEYSGGYVSHNSVLLPNIEEMYELVNSGYYRNGGYGYSLDNIMFLEACRVQYEIGKVIGNDGFVRTTFISPGHFVPIYGNSSPSFLSMCDVYIDDEPYECGSYVSGSVNVNSLAHFRGLPWKTEVFSQCNNLVAKSRTEFEILYNYKTYTTPPVNSLPLDSDVVGIGGPGSVDVPEYADNRINSYFIGFIRPTSTINRNDGIVTTEDVIAYNDFSGLPEIIRTTSSEGRHLFTKKNRAFEEKDYNQNHIYEGMLESNMLSQVSSLIQYEKQSGDNDFNFLPENVRYATAMTFSDNVGSNFWKPHKSYIFESELDAEGNPQNVFNHFNHSMGSNNENWELEGSYDLYAANGALLQTTGSNRTISSTIWGNNNTLPVMHAVNAEYGSCIFTNWAENDPLEANIALFSMSSSPEDIQISERTLKISSDLSRQGSDQYVIAAITPDINNLDPLGGQTYLIQFWARADRFINTYLQLQSFPGNQITDYEHFEIATEWKCYNLEITFPEGIVDTRYSLVLRPPYDPGSSNFTEGTIYFGDISVIHHDALSTITYYDPLWNQPVIQLDKNMKPGEKITYDEFGRPWQWHKIDPTKNRADAGYATVIKEKEYHFISEPIPPLVSFEAGTGSGPPNIQYPEIIVSISNLPYNERDFSVNYAVTGGTAGSDDFTLEPGMLTFNESSMTSTIPLVINESMAPGKTVVISLYDPSGAHLGHYPTFLYTRTEYDMVYIEFDANSGSGLPTIRYPDPPITISVSPTPVQGQVYTVEYAVTGGTADPGDFILEPGVLTFDASTVSRTIPLEINATIGSGKTIEISLIEPSDGAELGSKSTYVYTLLLNNPPSDPCNLTSTVISGGVRLSWECGDDPDGDEVEYGYDVYMHNPFPLPLDTIIHVTSGRVQDKHVVITDLEIPLRYHWSVTAIDEHGLRSGRSNSYFDYILPPNQPPTVPCNLSATNLPDNGKRLSWGCGDDAAGQIVTYIIEFRNAVDGSLLSGGTTREKFKVYDGAYHYVSQWRVRAFNQSGEHSNWSSWAQY
ncbi:hypothetical protein CHISP_3465 [Chitinispirillum alkaliphilum]|nr:hypothetical protein CHISP_3465 [Chitinispirillum alkaliphilum]